MPLPSDISWPLVVCDFFTLALANCRSHSLMRSVHAGPNMRAGPNVTAVPSVNKEWSTLTRSQFRKKCVVCTVTCNNNDEVNWLDSGKSHDGGQSCGAVPRDSARFQTQLSWAEVKTRMVPCLSIAHIHVLFMTAMHKHACMHARLHLHSHVLGSRAYLINLSSMKGWNGDKRMKCEWHSRVLSSAYTHTHTHIELCLVLNAVLQSGP